MLRSASTALATSLFALAALPAAAQNANLCGGVGENGQWLGGDEVSSDLSTAPDYIEQMALVLLRNEYVGLFTVSEAGDYRIEAEGRGGGDTVIDVRDAAGTFVASDDDSGGNAASRAETFLEPGTYCVSMRSFDGAPLTAFVRAGRVDTEALTEGFLEDTGNDTFVGECNIATAQPITLGESLTSATMSTPFYALSLNAPTAISLTAENEEADPILTLYDANGNWLAENDDFDGLNSRIDMSNALPAGNYCIALTVYGDESLPVTIAASEFDPAAALVSLYDRGEASPPLDGSYPVTALGEISTRLRQDTDVGGNAVWYSMEVSEAGMILVEAIAQGAGDPVLYMYDDLGRQVGYNDDAEGTLNSLLTVRVQPGTYLVAVKQLDTNTQGFVRLVFERYVAARP